MNHKFLLLAAAGTLALASCQSDVRTTDNDEVMQAKIDSAVQARMGEMQAQLAAQNDSLINAVAMMKADSMMAASAGNNNTGVRRTVPTRPTTTSQTSAPVTTPSRTEQDRKFENRENGGNNQTISPEKAKEQDDKFNRRGGGN